MRDDDVMPTVGPATQQPVDERIAQLRQQRSDLYHAWRDESHARPLWQQLLPSEYDGAYMKLTKSVMPFAVATAAAAGVARLGGARDVAGALLGAAGLLASPAMLYMTPLHEFTRLRSDAPGTAAIDRQIAVLEASKHAAAARQALG